MNTKPESLGYFAADPANGDFERSATLDEARAKAEAMLAAASDDAADSGWCDDPPQICYGAVIGHCVEVSRAPAPADSEFTEIVEFRLREVNDTVADLVAFTRKVGPIARRIVGARNHDEELAACREMAKAYVDDLDACLYGKQGEQETP